MKHILSFSIALLLFSACESQQENTNTPPTENNLVAVTQPETTMITPDPIEEPQLPIGHKAISATYKSCAVYAGSTVFYFIKDDGEGLEFRISHTDGYSEEEIADMTETGALEGVDIKFHEVMIDPSNDLEGPPGANPAFIDKRFALIYNEHGNLVEVKLLK